MLKEHKNGLLQLIQECGLDANLFYSEDDSKNKNSSWLDVFAEIFNGPRQREITFRVVLKDTPLMFVVRRGAESFDQLSFMCSQFKPGFPLGGMKKDVSVQRVRSAFKEWLNAVVKRYLNDNALPDLWSQLDSYQSFFGASTNSASVAQESESFTTEEKQTVRKSLSKFALC
jgi:hypothetical protein